MKILICIHLIIIYRKFVIILLLIDFANTVFFYDRDHRIGVVDLIFWPMLLVKNMHSQYK